MFQFVLLVLSFSLCPNLVQKVHTYPGDCLEPYSCKSSTGFKQSTLDCLDKCYDITPIEMMKNKQPHRVCRKQMFNSEKFTENIRRDICTKRKEEWRKCLKKKARMLAVKIKPEYDNNKKLKEYPHERQDCIYDCLKKQFGSLKCEHPRFPDTNSNPTTTDNPKTTPSPKQTTTKCPGNSCNAKG